MNLKSPINDRQINLVHINSSRSDIIDLDLINNTTKSATGKTGTLKDSIIDLGQIHRDASEKAKLLKMHPSKEDIKLRKKSIRFVLQKAMENEKE